jgi:hypothetical protein
MGDDKKYHSRKKKDNDNGWKCYFHRHSLFISCTEWMTAPDVETSEDGNEKRQEKNEEWHVISLSPHLLSSTHQTIVTLNTPDYLLPLTKWQNLIREKASSLSSVKMRTDGKHLPVRHVITCMSAFFGRRESRDGNIRQRHRT